MRLLIGAGAIYQETSTLEYIRNMAFPPQEITATVLHLSGGSWDVVVRRQVMPEPDPRYSHDLFMVSFENEIDARDFADRFLVGIKKGRDFQPGIAPPGR